MSAAPQPLPEALWGDQWQFVSLTAEALEFRLLERPIPHRGVSPLARPTEQHLDPNIAIPGVLINAGRQAMKLSRWLAEQQPVTLNAVTLALGAIILTTPQPTRWILATYQEETIRTAAQAFESRKRQSRGIHFLLIQPDDTGVTHSGLWVMQEAPILEWL